MDKKSKNSCLLYNENLHLQPHLNNVLTKELGELPEWLMEQFAKLSTGDCRVGSNPTLSANIDNQFGV